jgi:uncharacterized membrane protein
MPAGDNSSALAINNLGDVLITAWNPDTGNTDGYYLYNIYARTSVVLPPDPDALPGQTVFYNGLNDLGQVVGGEPSATRPIPAWASTLGYLPYTSFVYSTETRDFVNFMPTTPGAFVSEAFAINDLGEIAGINNTGSGDQGYLRKDGGFTTVDVLPTGPDVETGIPSGPTTDLAGINNLGVVAGYYSDPSSALTEEGFIYDSRMHKFTTLDSGYAITLPGGINDEGVVVGFMTDDQTESTGFGFFAIAGRVYELNYPGAAATSLNSINNLEQIVGEYLDANGLWHAFLLKCMPKRGGPEATKQ